MALNITTSGSVISKKSIGAFFAILALLVQPIVSLNIPAAFAAPNPTVSSETQVYETKENGRIAVTLTFSEPINPSSLGQGWSVQSGTNQTTFKKIYYSTKTYTINFTTVSGDTGTYTFTVDKAAPTVSSETQVYETKENGRIAVTLTFAEPINPSSIGQGWYEVAGSSNTQFKKAYYSTKTHTVNFKDVVGNPNVYTFTVDKNAPNEPTASLDAGTYVTEQLISLSSTDNSGVTPKIYYTNDGTTPTSASTLYTAPFTVSSTQTIKAVAYDTANNASGVMSKTYTINIPPPLPAQQTVIVRPNAMEGWANGDTRPGGSYSFISDTSSPLPSGALQVRTDSTNAAKVQLGRVADTRLDRLKKLSYSTKQLSANVPDGNASIQLAVYLDGSSSASYTNLVYEPYWNGSVQPNTWQTWDAFSGKFWSSRSYGALQAGGGGAPFYTIDDVLSNFPNAKIVGYAISAGSYNPGYQINVDGVYIASDQNNTLYDFEKNIPPSAPVNLTPANGSYTNDPDFKMTWSTVTGTEKYEYRTSNTLDGDQLGPIIYTDNSDAANYSISGGTVTRTNSGTPEGTYYWQVRALDSNGNPGQWSQINKVTTDYSNSSTPATINPNGFSNTNDVTFKWTQSIDTSASAVTYDLITGKHPNVNANGKMTTNVESLATDVVGESFTKNNMAEGPYFWQVRAKDSAGNYSAWSNIGVLQVDSEAPTSTADLASLVRGTVTITQTIDDAYPKSGKMRIWKLNTDGTQDDTKFFASADKNASSDKTVTYTLDTVANLYGDGLYRAKFTSTDVFNRTHTYTKEFTVDNTSPTGNMAVPARSAQIVTVELTASEPIQGLDDSWTKVDSRTFTKNHTENGSFSVSFTDLAGNSGSVDYKVTTVDTTAPSVLINGATRQSDGSYLVTGTTSDGSDTVLVSVNGSDPVEAKVNGQFWSFITDALEDGAYIVTATSTDTAGNTNIQGDEYTFRAATPTSIRTEDNTILRVSDTNITTDSQLNTIAGLNSTSVFGTGVTPDSATTDGTDDDGQVLGTQDSKMNDTMAAIAPSADGWKLFGVAWYWWLLVLAAIAAIWWFIAGYRRRNSENA